MPTASARFALPFLVPGQAQKEMFHNEALATIDSVLSASVEGAPLAVPPAAPADGESWIVGAGASGAWEGRADALATWTGGGWRFVLPVPGMQVWNKAAGLWLRWTGTAWSEGTIPASALLIGGQQVVGERRPEVPSPSGGTVIDAEARAAIGLLIATLKAHGLTE
ncbi:MAG TPA: DUF2793 domain-containing protein [Allosphingosinicella sp.]|nr:DUF2793 domain-containing protein [Allosphingosinicella sp.]